MYSKNFLVFGLLAFFACQGATANSINEVDRAYLPELIVQVKDIIVGLNKLVSGVLGDALTTLANLTKTVLEIKKNSLNEGIKAIQDAVDDVIKFIANETSEAADLGLDITRCISGRDDQLENLVEGHTLSLTNCITDTVSRVLTTIDNEINKLNKIVSSIVAAPVKLTKCLIWLRPITCVTNLLSDLTPLLSTLPGQTIKVVDEATDLVRDLPPLLLDCITNIISPVTTQITKITEEIRTCVDNIIAGNSTTIVVPRASLPQLISHVEQIIVGLRNLVNGVIAKALATLLNLTEVIGELKTKFLDIVVIGNAIANVTDYVKNVTKEAADLGIDITKCTIGVADNLKDLSSRLTVNLTDCVTDSVVLVLEMVNSDIKAIDGIVRQITNAPVRLSKCLITMRPISCVTKLLVELTVLLTTIPGTVEKIVENALGLVADLSRQLSGCVQDIGIVAGTQSKEMISNIGTCFNNAIFQGN